VFRKAALSFALVALLALSLGLAVYPAHGTAAVIEPLRWSGAARAEAERTVFVGAGLSDEQVLAFTTAIQASGHPGVVLFDAPSSTRWTRAFFKQFRPGQVLGVGAFPDGAADLEARLGLPRVGTMSADPDPVLSLQQALFAEAPRVVVAPAEPRRALLQAACLAGAVRAPLLITPRQVGAGPLLRWKVGDWGIREVFAVGEAVRQCRAHLAGVRIVPLADERAVAAAYLRALARTGPITTLVLANPADSTGGRKGMSSLAPWIALQRHAALVLTNDEGSNAETVLRSELGKPSLRQADALIIVADLRAIPMERRPNPIEGDKDEAIEMEPLTPRGDEPVSLATGRLFHEDPNVVALMLARARLLRPKAGQIPKALIVSNPGGGLPLLEALSRSTADEFRNAGYDTTPFFGRRASREQVRRLLPQQTIFLWEGHHSTLVREYGIHHWPEPLKPSLVFLQSCLALQEPKAHPFLERGSVGVVGSSTRTYSGSGGAFALAYFDALLYEGQSLGGSLRHAKNFMLAFAQLKEKRLGGPSRLKGANLRAAWAFTLWGDPTLKLPRPARPVAALQQVGHEVRGNTIFVSLPKTTHTRVVTAGYQAEVRPNTRLAGLRHKQDEDSKHQLVPLVFAEVALPQAPAGKTPTLQSRLPSSRWVFCWDGRARRGYLLLTPRATDHGELRFQVKWH
jgi:hypothetical protein